MQLYIIRHGQSYGNLPDWAHGNTDEALTELGKQQAAALGKWLPTALPQVDKIYCTCGDATHTPDGASGSRCVWDGANL